ncbi:OmpA family protein [Pseudoruegeria sp. HB172150]|uniref:OmpA family protein n=1 Tax=Pseudoruegeria sp. HB172150 TaxID=2721164 RepID=UPI001555E0EF|nr:OmpA family protein [Pseudoruegeria sp. HB172150]
MTHRIRILSASTALVALTAVVPQMAAAQSIPGCRQNIEAKPIAEITQENLTGEITMEDLPGLLETEGVCVRKNGKLRVLAPEGEEAQAETPVENPPAEENAEAPATEAPAAEEDAAAAESEGAMPAVGEVVEGLSENLPGMTSDESGDAQQAETAEPAETPAAKAPAQAEASAEPAEQPAAETTEETAQAPAEEPAAEPVQEETAEAPAPAAEAEGDAEATAETDQPAADPAPEQTAESAETPEQTNAPTVGEIVEELAGPEVAAELTGEDAAPEKNAKVSEETAANTSADGELAVSNDNGKPVAAAAAAADEGAGEEVVETKETKVTEENSRSSGEEFEELKPKASAEANDDDDGGLSNFEKFALGAAGLVVLDQLIGNNDQVVENTGDRVVVQRQDGSYYVLKDEDELLRRPGSDVQTETFRDGSTRTTVTRPNGVKVVTISAADGTVLRRAKVMPDGRQVVLFDDTQGAEPVQVSQLPAAPTQETVEADNEAALRAALEAERAADVGRRFTLSQVRNIREVRQLMPEINIDAINFETGSSAIRPNEAEDLYALGEALREFIGENPEELFLIEGHTDAVGGAAMNLALSDRRAESVALALTEYFDVPPENMIVQGYGEEFLLVPTDDAERTNRRATVRRITPLLTVADASAG